MEMAHIISINANKGGVGKTTLTSNLAPILSANKKVLMIDADPQGNLSIAFGYKPKKHTNTLYDVLMGTVKAHEVIIPIQKNLDLLPSNKDMNFIDLDILTDREKFPEPLRVLRKRCGYLRYDYDVILIDTPPSLGLLAGNVLVFADQVLIPFIPDLYAIEGLKAVLEELDKVKNRENPNLSLLGIVAMMVNRRATTHTQLLSQARKFSHKKSYTLFDTIIPETTRFETSVAKHGKPAILTDKDKLVTPYYDLAKEIELLCETKTA